VELTDNHRELNHRSGRMLRISAVHPGTRQIEFEQTIDDDLIPTGNDGDTPAARRTRLIRCDQRGEIVSADGTVLTDLDAEGSDGLIPVPGDDSPVVLESGITVSFSTAPGPGGFREMGYWCFWARTAGTRIQRLRAMPPDGIQRHDTRLAILRFPSSALDCRVFWPPAFEGGDTAATCQAAGNALVVGATDLRLEDCEISSGARGGDGVRLAANIVPSLTTDARIIGNTMLDIAGAAVRIEGEHGALLIKQNIIRRCAGGGIISGTDAAVRDLCIDNNVIEEVADVTGQTATGGIVLLGVAAGRVIGNTLRSIGRGRVSGQTYAGIALQGVGTITLRDNEIIGVGPDLPEVAAMSILAQRGLGPT
jgi:hypothetical protein